MKKRDLQNAKLDEIGRKLLAATRAASEEELDRIVGSPKLFDGVKARIKAEQRERAAQTFFGDWRNLFVWNGQKIAASLAVLMFVALGTLGVIVLTKQDSSPALAEKIAPPPQINLPDAPVEISPPVETFAAPPEIVKTQNFARKNRLSFQKAVFKNETPAAAPKRALRRKNPLKRQTIIEPEGEFYALAFAGKPFEGGEDLRIVRAELSRSSLFALGVNLPIENESDKIKTDLLVGADGVAKAIRFVK